MKTVFVNDCAADGCYKKNLGKGKQMCKEHQQMYEERKVLQSILRQNSSEKGISNEAII